MLFQREHTLRCFACHTYQLKGNANCDQTTVFGTLNMNHSKHNGEKNSEVPCSLQGWLIVFCLFGFFFFQTVFFLFCLLIFQWAASQRGDESFWDK